MHLAAFDQAAAYFPDICFQRPPDLGIMLGSGWGEALEMDEIVFRASYADIPGLGASTVRAMSGSSFFIVASGNSSPRGADAAITTRARAGSRWCCRRRCCGGWARGRFF